MIRTGTTLQNAIGEFMWSLMEELFPHYRALCGPDFARSLDMISAHLPLDVTEIPSGTRVFDWTVPKEFSVREAWVEHESGKRFFDFATHPYHLWIYAQPFDGTVTREELLDHVSTLPDQPDVIPMRQAYYRPHWGFCASQRQAEALPDGKYRVHIDTVHEDGALRLAEHYLPGDTDSEVMITSYLCHPRGANDNLSGISVAVALFRLLAAMPRRRYSYRLVILPETIGSISYIARFPDRLEKVIGGYAVECCGDDGPVGYKTSRQTDSIIDRAYLHALSRIAPDRHHVVPYNHYAIGADACQFNAVGVRKPFGTAIRGGPGGYVGYHSSMDDLDLVRPEALSETLEVILLAIETIERNAIYRGKYVVDPFLSARGIYPYEHGAGDGKIGNDIALAYYQLMGFADGSEDLLSIADKAGLPITAFDQAVRDFLENDLIEEVAR